LKSLTLFNNKGGVGKTTLIFNIAHMLARQGNRVVALDYDPQCNLSALFLEEDDLYDTWSAGNIQLPDGTVQGRTVAACVDIVRRGKGELLDPKLISIADNLWLLPGHIGLSRFEQTLAEEWPKIQAADNERALDVTTALDRLSNKAAAQVDADVVVIDVGPSLGALNRAAVLACDAIVVPLAPDLFSLQGLENVGPVLREWRDDWQTACQSRFRGEQALQLPLHQFHPIGYIVQQHLARADRIPSGYQHWASKIPFYFHHYVLGEDEPQETLSIESDDQCLALIKHHASLVPIAQQAAKPMFDLKQADGIGGAQLQAVARFRKEFGAIVERIHQKLDALPEAKPIKSNVRR
jgi:chromosome partitioning protein